MKPYTSNTTYVVQIKDSDSLVRIQIADAREAVKEMVQQARRAVNDNTVKYTRVSVLVKVGNTLEANARAYMTVMKETMTGGQLVVTQDLGGQKSFLDATDAVRLVGGGL